MIFPGRQEWLELLADMNYTHSYYSLPLYSLYESEHYTEETLYIDNSNKIFWFSIYYDGWWMHESLLEHLLQYFTETRVYDKS